MGRLGAPAPQPARAPGPLAFSDAGYVEEILAAAGFEDIAIARIGLMMPGGRSVEEEAALMRHVGPASRLMLERPTDAATRAALAADIAEALRPFETDAGMLIPPSVFYVEARRA